MRYDIVTPINDDFGEDLDENSKNAPEHLTPTQIELIKLLQDQRLPELDGLKFANIEYEYVEVNQSNEDDNELDDNDEDNYTIKKYFINLTNRFNDWYELRYTDNEIIVNDIYDRYELMLGKIRNNYVFRCNYVYGPDIICFEKKYEESETDPTIRIEIFINAADDDNSEEIENKNGRPIGLDPDVDKTLKFKYSGKYILDNDDYEIDSSPSRMINRCRHVCNMLADNYHFENIDSLKCKR